MKQTVFSSHKIELQEADAKLRVMGEEITQTKVKMDTLYDALPHTINDIVNGRIESIINTRFTNLAKKDEVEEHLRRKVDSESFKDYTQQRLAKDELMSRQLQINDRFFDIKKQFDTFVVREDFVTAIKGLADHRSL